MSGPFEQIGVYSDNGATPDSRSVILSGVLPKGAAIEYRRLSIQIERVWRNGSASASQAEIRHRRFLSKIANA